MFFINMVVLSSWWVCGVEVMYELEVCLMLVFSVVVVVGWERGMWWVWWLGVVVVLWLLLVVYVVVVFDFVSVGFVIGVVLVFIGYLFYMDLYCCFVECCCEE